MRNCFLGLATCLLLATLADAGSPTPARSEWLLTEGGGFKVDGDVRGHDGRLRYLLQFRLRKPVTETLYLTVDFENPEDRELALFTEFELAPGTRRFMAKSEMIPAIRIRETYRVKVWIYADVERRQLLGTHEQRVLFNMPRKLLQQLGIEAL